MRDCRTGTEGLRDSETHGLRNPGTGRTVGLTQGLMADRRTHKLKDSWTQGLKDCDTEGLKKDRAEGMKD